jgi:hypothetical protein
MAVIDTREVGADTGSVCVALCEKPLKMPLGKALTLPGKCDRGFQPILLFSIIFSYYGTRG